MSGTKATRRAVLAWACYEMCGTEVGRTGVPGAWYSLLEQVYRDRTTLAGSVSYAPTRIRIPLSLSSFLFFSLSSLPLHLPLSLPLSLLLSFSLSFSIPHPLFPTLSPSSSTSNLNSACLFAPGDGLTTRPRT
eukprot:2087453-Rhodomonas_salina.7